MAIYKYKRSGHGSFYVPGEEIPSTKSRGKRQNKEAKCPKNYTINETNLFVQVVQTSFEY